MPVTAHDGRRQPKRGVQRPKTGEAEGIRCGCAVAEFAQRVIPGPAGDVCILQRATQPQECIREYPLFQSSSISLVSFPSFSARIITGDYKELRIRTDDRRLRKGEAWER